MARSVFFSFHYKDVSSFRANVVRQSWLTMKDRSATFIDKSLWEEAESKGVLALKKLVEDSLIGTSVTIVLVGSETAERRWVKYEIVKSFVEGKGIFVIHLNRIRSKNEGITARGTNPLSRLRLKVSNDCQKISFYELVNRRWVVFKDLPEVNNRKANSFYFPEFDNGFDRIFNLKSGHGGKIHKFSELFPQEYDWVTHDGYHKISDWIESAFFKVNSD